MALTNLAVFGGAFFTPILVGKITHTIGWPWSFYFVAIFTGVCLPLVFFFVPETAFRRSAHFNTDIAPTDDLRLYEMLSEADHGAHNSSGEAMLVNPPIHNANETAEPEIAALALADIVTAADNPRRGFSERLWLFSGRKSNASFFKLLLRPFPLFAHPAILWACVIQGCMIGWTVFIGIVLAAIFLGPPLFWDEVNTGYAYAGAFIGAVVGFLISGALADWSAKYMTRKNHGIYEPEFRIVLAIPQLVIGCAGLYIFGISSATLSNYPWVLPVVGFGLQVGGMVIGAVAASLYIVDAHRRCSRTQDISIALTRL